MDTNDINSEIPDELVIEFREPIVYAKEEYARMVLREPNVGQLKAANKKPDPLDSAAMLLSLISGVPVGVIDRLPQSQFEEAMDYIGGFTKAGQKNSDSR